MRIMSRQGGLAAATLLVLTIGGPARADVQEGLRAYTAKDYTRAEQELKTSADAGDVEGQFYLGNLYVDGIGIAQNYREAVRYYEMAAEQGHTGAQVRLGNMYRRGYGVDTDYRKAVRWLYRAFDGGSSEAALYLGDIFLSGEGDVERDEGHARQLFTIAANEGLAQAMAKLGLIYLEGRGTERDVPQAIMWLKLASQATEGEVKEEVDAQLLRAEKGATASDWAKGQKMAANWTPWSLSGGSRPEEPIAPKPQP